MTQYMDESMEVEETFGFKEHDPIWVRWEDNEWYPAEIVQDCGALDVIIRWLYQGEWNREATCRISRIKRRIVYAGQSVDFG
jgi:hypothetical protein